MSLDRLRTGSAPGAPPRIGVVADDITGSGDIGVMFAKHGYAVRIFGASVAPAALTARLAGTRCDVAILDTDSRFDPAAVAAGKVARATRALQVWGAELFYNKTCSVFRGNIGAEFDAMMEVLGERFAVALAAFPKNGRVTRGGMHLVHGRPLHESEFARDPLHPRVTSDLGADRAGQTARRVVGVSLDEVRGERGDLAARLAALRAGGAGYALCDAESQDDVAAIARAVRGDRVVLGSSALAEELPPLFAPAPPFEPLHGVELRPGRAVLAVAGSVMPQTAAQVAALASAGAAVFTVEAPDLLDDLDAAASRTGEAAADALLAGRHAVVRSDGAPEAVEAARALGAARGLSPVAVSRAVSRALARAAELAVARSGADRILALGGDTSAAVCAALGVEETVVLDELAAGLPVSLAPGPPARLLVLKSGSFGGPDFGLRAVERLARGA